MTGHYTKYIKIKFVLYENGKEEKITVEKANKLLLTGEYYPSEDVFTFSQESIIKFYKCYDEVTVYLEKIKRND